MTTVVRPTTGQARPDGAMGIGRAQRRPMRRYFALNGATIVTIAALALSAIGILYLMQTSQVASLGYRIAYLQRQHDNLALETSRLVYEVARHEAIETVEQVAIQDLNMSPLQNFQFIEIRRPLDANLPAPEPETLPEPSFWERIVGAVMGVGWAQSDTEPVGAARPVTAGEESR